jgi:hypothetical protein
MPTGYTDAVQEGKITSFRDFALRCARNFGANVLMRDEPLDAPIKEYKPSSYEKERLEETKAHLYDVERMTIEGAQRQQLEQNKKRAAQLLALMERKNVEQERYEAMLCQVREWQPPTIDHEGLKKFMIEQLTDSIRHDCYDPSEYYKPDTRSSLEYLRAEIERARRDVRDAEESWQKEQQRTRERNEWNRALVTSLPVR